MVSIQTSMDSHTRRSAFECRPSLSQQGAKVFVLKHVVKQGLLLLEDSVHPRGVFWSKRKDLSHHLAAWLEHPNNFSHHLRGPHQMHDLSITNDLKMIVWERMS